VLEYYPLGHLSDGVALFAFYLDLLPRSYDDGDKQAALEGLLDSTVLVVLPEGEIPLGVISLEVFKKSVTLHGISHNPGVDKRVFAVAIERAGAEALEHVFMRLKKRQCICKVPDDAVGAKGFLRRWGFVGMSDGQGGVKRDKGRSVYRLSYDEFEKGYVKWVRKRQRRPRHTRLNQPLQV